MDYIYAKKNNIDARIQFIKRKYKIANYMFPLACILFAKV